jgi:hypothetical protein
VRNKISFIKILLENQPFMYSISFGMKIEYIKRVNGTYEKLTYKKNHGNIWHRWFYTFGIEQMEVLFYIQIGK